MTGRDRLRQLPRLRGFPTAVARATASAPRLQVGSIRIGVDEEGGEVRVQLEMTHADGTVLVAHLCNDAMDRLADILAEQLNIVGLAMHPGSSTVQ